MNEYKQIGIIKIDGKYYTGKYDEQGGKGLSVYDEENNQVFKYYTNDEDEALNKLKILTAGDLKEWQEDWPGKNYESE